MLLIAKGDFKYKIKAMRLSLLIKEDYFLFIKQEILILN